MNARVRNNRVANIVGTNGEATPNSNGRTLIDFCTFNNLKIMNTFFKHKEIHKFTWEARGHTSIIDNFITNMKTSKLIEDIRVYRSNEIDSDHYLLCVKVNFPPWWLNKSNKKTPLKQDEFFKVRLLNDESIRWLYTQSIRRLYTRSIRWLYIQSIRRLCTQREKLNLSSTKGDEIGIEKEWKNLQNRSKYLKIWDGQIKQLTETKKKIIQKMVEFKETRK